MIRIFAGRGKKETDAEPAARSDRVPVDMEALERAVVGPKKSASQNPAAKWEAAGSRHSFIPVKLYALLMRTGLEGRAFTAEHGLGLIGIGIAVASSAFASYMITQNQSAQHVAGVPAKRQPLTWTQISHFAKADIDPMTTGSITPSVGKASDGLAGSGDGGVGFDPSARKLPGFVLRDVFEGMALVEGTDGVRAIRPGFTLPEGSKVTAIERHAGKWVVLTTGGIIAEAP